MSSNSRDDTGTGPAVEPYVVQPGDTFRSIAERFRVDAWEDLWDHNAPLLKGRIDSPDLLVPEVDGVPVVLEIPNDRDHALARELLAERGVDVDAVFSGTSWLDPRGLVSVTVLGSDGNPVPAGTRVSGFDPVLGAIEAHTDSSGRAMLCLPRAGYELSVDADAKFEEEFGWFRDEIRAGDLMAAAATPPPPPEPPKGASGPPPRRPEPEAPADFEQRRRPEPERVDGDETYAVEALDDDVAELDDPFAHSLGRPL